jgi:hypothetical protein
VAVAAGTPAGGTAGVVAAHPGERVAGAEPDEKPELWQSARHFGSSPNNLLQLSNLVQYPPGWKSRRNYCQKAVSLI